MPLKYNVDHARGVHNLAPQQQVRHSTGTGNIYQQLESLRRAEGRLQKQYDMWVARAVRCEERMAQIEAEERRLLASLEPAIEAAERELGLR